MSLIEFIAPTTENVSKDLDKGLKKIEQKKTGLVRKAAAKLRKIASVNKSLSRDYVTAANALWKEAGKAEKAAAEAEEARLKIELENI